MAQTAANEVVKVRKQFESSRNIRDYIIKHACRDGWPIYDAAISSGLIGDLTSARFFFERMAAWVTPGYNWQEELKRDSATLAAIVDQPALFRARILDLIGQRRHLTRLPPDPDCLDTLDLKVSLDRADMAAASNTAFDCRARFTKFLTTIRPSILIGQIRRGDMHHRAKIRATFSRLRPPK